MRKCPFDDQRLTEDTSMWHTFDVTVACLNAEISLCVPNRPIAARTNVVMVTPEVSTSAIIMVASSAPNMLRMHRL